MKKVITICAVLGFVCVAQATMYTYDVAPGDLGDQDSWGSNVPFGYDATFVPIGSTTMSGAPGYGDSAFWSDVQGSANPGGRDYCSLRIAPHAVFGREIASNPVTVSELDNLSYFTNWVSGANWQVKIYTAPVDGEDTSWYRNRFNFNRAPDATGWNQTDIDALGVDWIHNKTSNASLHDQTLDYVKTTYGSEVIMWIDVIAGYMTDSPAGDTYLDGIEISLTNGDIANVNLVPEPTTMVLLGLGGLLLRRKK